MGEDPIIVKPGVYRNSNGSTREGVCLVFDDDSWAITEGANGITITIPPNSRWKVVEDRTTPSPDDPSGRVKKKVALLRERGTLGNVNKSRNLNGEVRISFTVRPADD
jgi:hypothetical protein